MNNKDIDAQFLCKDCARYNLCEYYHRRRNDSYICKYFHLSVTPQEPILDKIREQIKDYLRGVEITLEVLVENDPLRPKMEGAKDTLEECLNLIDMAKAEADHAE